MKSVNEIFDTGNLRRAWELVKSKNKTGGIDNISTEEFEKEVEDNLEKLQKLIFLRQYTPEPNKTIYIPKDNNESRKLNLPTIHDKIVQICVLIHFQPLFENIFSENSFAYRLNKSHTKAINKIDEYLKSGSDWVLTCDINNFFDSICKNKLMKYVEKYFQTEYVCTLIELWIKVGSVYKEKYIESEKGISQGSVISPLLSNLYLHELDKELETQEIKFVRYADNFLIASNTKSDLEEKLNQLIRNLNDLGLELNTDETIINHTAKGISFCGVYFINGKRIISPARLEKKKLKITEIIKINNFREIELKINDYFKGIKRYFSKFDTSDQFLILEEHFKKEIKTKIFNSSVSNVKFNYRDELKLMLRIEYLLEKDVNMKNNIYKDLVLKIKNEIIVSSSEDRSSSNVDKKLIFKRRKYTKLFYTNVDVIVSTPGSMIGKSGENIVIRNSSSPKKEISSNKVKNIIIVSEGITLSSNFLKMCSDKDIRIDFLDNIGKPYCSLITPTSDYFQISALQSDLSSNKKSMIISYLLIESKIRNQANILKYFLKNKESNNRLTIFINEEIEKMERYTDNFKNIDLSKDFEELRNQLFGYEGFVAALYWNCVNALLPEEYNFEKREHKGSKDLVNMLFNYAYGILYTKVLAAVTIAGLNPNIGFFHSNQKGKPVLIYDIIEQFRAPFADRAVISLLTKGSKVTKDNNLLSKETRNLLAGKVLSRLNTEIVYKGKRINNNSLILEKTRELVLYLKGEEKTFKPFIMKW